MIPEYVNFCFCDFETTGIEVYDYDSDTYPIEIGCIFTDHNLMIKDTYKSLIKWNEFVCSGNNDWPEGDMKEAYNIHKIDYGEVVSNGEYPKSIVSLMISKIVDNFGKKKVTIVSDNAYFETYCMAKLFKQSEYDFRRFFHYTSWDINLLLKAVGIERIEEHNHRALDDAASMYHQTLRALQKINYFDGR